jgi:type IV pilus assembly protein PilW
MKDRFFLFSRSKEARVAVGCRAKGFTLIELMVTLAVASIVMAAIYGVYATLTRSYTTENVAADVQQAARAAIDFMAEDIVMAGLDPQGAASAIVSAAAADIRFTADRNMNGTIDNSDFEDINYFISGTRLIQRLYGDNTTDQTVADNVTNLTFQYLDADDNDLGDPVPAANLTDIRTVIISMTVEEPAGRGGPVERTYTTRVRCRNLGL